MNCQQIEGLMPLYAGGDLGEGRARLIDAHLQSCRACAVAAAEFRETRQLLQEFSAPTFDEDVFAEIRQSVWRQIEAETRPSLFESIGLWFRPGFVWTAAAAALLITASALGIFFVVNRSRSQTEIVASKPREVVPPETGASGVRASGTVNPRAETPRRRQVNMPKPESKHGQRWAPDRNDSVVAYSPDAQGARIVSSSPIVGTEDNLDIAARAAGKTLRMEIQTRNPNIRIIWFTQPN